ncbi:hypothetical protein GCM10023197_08580 [Gordonia humi]
MHFGAIGPAKAVGRPGYHRSRSLADYMEMNAYGMFPAKWSMVFLSPDCPGEG